ncbi:NUDIX domain-containing protein [uncultured Methylovirgula sp.]|uniref:NUDIX domain-containing protein n=1 Tax=uncultured Methylovirgula sp. TaxID=1285960 RepID=UPI00260C8577|nr:NUDIX domain-containing protein [uncultured Methylovirgula sp.]
MSGAVKILCREIVSRGFGLLERVTWRRRKFDGTPQEITREFYDTGPGATILLYDRERRRILLVRQFRPAVYLVEGRDSLLETCAGKLEGAAAAERIVMEVLEETGLRIGAPTYLFSAYMSPGVYAEKISFFTAPYSPRDRVTNGGGLADEGEDIEIVEPTLDEALAMIETGEIADAKTILLIHYAVLHRLMER